MEKDTGAEFLPAGKITSTHGVRGELKLRPDCDSAEFLLPLKTLYIGTAPVIPSGRRVHKGHLLLTLPGVDSIEKAMPYIGREVFFKKSDVRLPEGSYFLSDLEGSMVYDLRLEREIGRLKDVIFGPANDVYLVSDGESDTYIPAVPEFIKAVDIGAKKITVKTIPGMGQD